MVKRKTKFKKLEGEERYTSNEIPVSQLQARAEEENTKSSKQNKNIEQSIRYLNELNLLESESFHLIHVNWHCFMIQRDKYDELNNVNIFYPAEIAISEFSLKQGLIRRFHKFVNSQIPKGFAAEAQERREKIHKLPVHNELGESDLKIVYSEMKSFLQHGQDNGSIPPLYTRPDDVNSNSSLQAVCSVMKTLYFHAVKDANFVEAALSNDEWEKEFKIYPLNKLLSELGMIYTPDLMKDSLMADVVINKDPYMYHADIACSLHDELDCINNCSLSIVSRWAMTIREFCCKQIVANETLHVPSVQSNGKTLSSNASSSAESVKAKFEEHSKLYPAMKTKENSSGGEPVFVHNSSATKNQTPSSSGSNVSVGSAWCRPLVHQGPGIQNNLSNGGSSPSAGGAVDNFPPLGGLRISNSQNIVDGAANKKSQGRKKK